MTLKNTVGTLAQGAVSTAVSVVRHPISTASMAAGLVKGTAEASVDLVRGVVRGQEQLPGQVQDKVQDQVEDKVEVPTQREDTVVEPEGAAPTVTGTSTAPREPEVVPKPVPEIDELPEPIVIEADDTPGEAFHTEPKAASRDSEHGGSPGDREEAEGYVEEIPSEITGQPDEDPVVWTSESSGAQEPADVNRPG